MQAGAGRVAGVLEATIASMEALGARPRRYRRGTRPHHQRGELRKSGPRLVAAFREADPAHERFFTPNAAGRAQFDLPGFIGARLDAAGIAAFEDIARLHLCGAGALPLLPPPHPPPGAGPRGG